MKLFSNSKGQIYYGMHFYPGVAEYQEPGIEPYRVFLNEDTIRSMDPTFAGRPIFVEHVDEVSPRIDDLKKEADGWVVESFYNSADGKHWVKFIVVSERGEKAIKNGMRLSNAYKPKTEIQGGLWNGVSYLKEITSGEYEHLAIVRHPRYQESVILTPEQFKKYNEDKTLELKKLSNSSKNSPEAKQGETSMKLNFFKRQKVENEIDPDLCVLLPLSKKEMSLTEIINSADELMQMKKDGVMADLSHQVKMHDGTMCNVGDLLEKHKALSDEVASLKKDSSESEEDLATAPASVDVEGDLQNKEEEEKPAKEEKKENQEPSEEEKAAKKQNELEAALKKETALKKAEAIKNAHLKAFDKEDIAKVDLSMDRVARGKVKYGSQ